jgi:hypothetical protein
MTAQWAVICLVSLLVVLNSIAIITLMRRASRPPADTVARLTGPPPGTRLDVGTPVEALNEGADSVMFCFISPICGECRTMLPAFAAMAGRMRVVLVSAVEEGLVRAHLAEQRIDLPLVTGPDVFDANDIPWPPYAVVTTGLGIVLAQGGANRPEQLETLLDRAAALGRLHSWPAPKRLKPGRPGRPGGMRVIIEIKVIQSQDRQVVTLPCSGRSHCAPADTKSGDL